MSSMDFSNADVMANGEKAIEHEAKAKDELEHIYGAPAERAKIHVLLAISHRLAELEKTLGTRDFIGPRGFGNF